MPADLVASPINVVVQDRKNANLLIVGNDLGVWVSIDAGAAWTRLKANLPTVPVHDLTIHPRENDLVLGTYGRGIFIGDITHLQELSAEVLAKPLHLFAVEPRAAYGFRALGNFDLFGNKYIEVPNEPDALVINYYLRATQDGGAQVTICGHHGRPVAELKGPSEAGINRVQWNMRAARATVAGGRHPYDGLRARRLRWTAAAARRLSDRRRRRRTAGDDHRPDPGAHPVDVRCATCDVRIRTTRRPYLAAVAALALVTAAVSAQQKIYWGDEVPAGLDGHVAGRAADRRRAHGYTRTTSTLQLHRVDHGAQARRARTCTS